MKRNKYIFILAVCALLAGSMLFTVSGCGRKEVDKAAQKKIMYHCPMHPQYTSDKPGDCPICGMKLVKMETKPEPAQALKTPAASPEKAIEEVCVEHKCTMKGCTMDVKARLKPGERVICPICGEVIATTSGKVVEIVKTSAVRETPSAGKERKVLYYRNPMNPQATSSVPAKDSMGMDYVPVYEEGARPETAGPTVMISPEKQQLIGVRTEPVGKRDLKKVVRASGKIAYDPELVITQEEFIQALANEGNTKDSPLRDVIDRAKLLTDAAKAKLKLLGMSDEQIAGLVITKKAETNLYLPGKDESVWAYISIYEYEIGLVKPQAEVEIEAVAYPGEIFKGTVVSINPVLDPMTRTNQVRVEIPAPDNKLKPEMFVNAKIYADLGEKLAVPESAILDTGLRKIVYLSEADNVLEQREITVGQKAEGYQEILGGLKEGDIVVTSGNFLIDSEAKLKSASQ